MLANAADKEIYSFGIEGAVTMSNDLLFSILPRVSNTTASKLKDNVKKPTKNKTSGGLNDDERAAQKEVRKVSEKEQHLRHEDGQDEHQTSAEENQQDQFDEQADQEATNGTHRPPKQESIINEEAQRDEDEKTNNSDQEHGKKGDNLDIYI